MATVASVNLGAADAADALQAGTMTQAAYVDSLLARYDETRFGFALAPGFSIEGARARAGLEKAKPTLEELYEASQAAKAPNSQDDDGPTAEDDEDDPERAAARKAKAQARALAEAEAIEAKVAMERANSDPAADPLGPLAGVPFVVSDTIDVRGMATSASNAALARCKAARSAPVVRRLQSAGGFVLGKGTVHDLGWGATGTRTPRGRVANPYSRGSCVAGGAAAGAAAAVSARLAPAALSVDSLGDARVPAHCCGVVCFRPTPGRYPDAGCLMQAATLDTVAVTARTVEDVQLLDSVLCRPSADERKQALPAHLADADLKALEAAAISLQATTRGFLTRKHKAAGTLVAPGSGSGQRLKHEQLTTEVEEAAVRIQAVARGRQGRMRVAQIRAIAEEDEGEDEDDEDGQGGGDESTAAGGADDGADAGGEESKEAEDEGPTARESLEGTAAMTYGQAEEAAATRIQAIARGRLSRDRVAEKRQVVRLEAETEAAVRIQALERGRKARAKVSKARATRAEAGDQAAATMAPHRVAATAAGVDGLAARLAGVTLAVPASLCAGCDSTVVAVLTELVERLRKAGVNVVVECDLPEVTAAAAGATEADGRTACVDRAQSVVDTVRGFEAVRELAVYLSARGLDKERDVVVEAAKGRSGASGEEEEEDEEAEDEAAKAAHAVKLQVLRERVTVTDALEAYGGSKADSASLKAALDPRGALGDGGTAVDAAAYVEALAVGRPAVLRAVMRCLGRHGAKALLFPTALVPAVAEKGSDGDAVYCNGSLVSSKVALTRNVAIATAAGLPAVTLPGGMTRKRATAGVGLPGGERMPVGIELVGLPGTDSALLAIARSVQDLLPALPDPVLRSKWQRGVHD